MLKLTVLVNLGDYNGRNHVDRSRRLDIIGVVGNIGKVDTTEAYQDRNEPWLAVLCPSQLISPSDFASGIRTLRSWPTPSRAGCLQISPLSV